MIITNEKLKKISKVVEDVLERYPTTRINDNILILRVINKMFPNDNLVTVLKENKISLESITRSRRKVQKNRPELKDPKVTIMRNDLQQEFIDFNFEVLE